MIRKVFVASIILLAPLWFGACDRTKLDAKDAPRVIKITDNVYVIQTTTKIPNKANRGFINNPGIVITSKGVAIIDPGSSSETGNRVIAEVKKLTDKPIIAVFNTHIHGDHWLGNGAIKKAYPKAIIYAHPEMLALAKAGEGDNWIKLLNRMTDGALGDTRAVTPDIPVNDGETLKLGNTAFLIHHKGKAHTNNDIMVQVTQEKVIFLGDNVINGRIAGLDGGSFSGNIKIIDAALASGATHFIPGHGAPGGPEVAKRYQTYLKITYDSVKKMQKQDMVAFEMKPKIVAQLQDYKNWDEFDREVGRNISFAYAQIEEEMFQ